MSAGTSGIPPLPSALRPTGPATTGARGPAPSRGGAGPWVLAAVALLGAAVPSPAQDGGLELDRSQPVVIRGHGNQFGFPDPADPGRLVWVFLDGVEIEQGTRRIYGDTLVVVLDREGEGDDDGASGGAAGTGTVLSGGRVLEFFVDGDVSFEDRDETVIGAASLHVDNTTGRMSVLEGSWRAATKDESFIVRYDVMRDLGNGVREMEGLLYTTCEYAHEHWALHTPWARMVPTPDGRVLHTGGNRFEVGDIPLLWFPGLHLNVDRDRPPIKSVSFGTSSRYGTEIATLWGADADDFLTSLGESLGMDGPVRGAWEARLENYSSRGLFFEPSIEYQSESSMGRIFGATINDRNALDELDQPIEDDTRGRFDVQHRTRIDERRVIDVEVSHLSDEGFLREYYEGEFREGKEQETYVSFRDVHDNDALSILGRWRMHDWETQAEYLPEITHRRMAEPIQTPFGTAHLTRREFVSHARVASPDEGVETEWNTRAGTVGNLVLDKDVFDGDRLQVSAGWDVTGFEDTVADESSELRAGVRAGAAWGRTYSGTGDASSDVWNFRGVRQILEPRVTYDALLELSHQPGELIPIDDVETLRDASTFRVGLRHRVQTHQRGAQVTVLDTDVSVPFFPHEDRDNLVTVYDEELTNLATTPAFGPSTAVVAGEEGRTVGNVRIDMRWKPGADIPGLRQAEVLWRAEIDPRTWSYERSFVSYSNSFGENGRFALSNSKVNTATAESDFGGLGVLWELSPKWSVAYFLQQDLLLHEPARQSLVLREKAHRWLIDFEYSTRRGRSTVDDSSHSDRRVSVRVRPSILADESETLLDEMGRLR